VELPPFDADTPFMEAGFTSLTASKLAGELQSQIGEQLSPVILFECPTARDLFEQLSAKGLSHSSVDEFTEFLVSYRDRARVLFGDSSRDDSSPPSADDLEHDAHNLDPDIIVPKGAYSTSASPKFVLLTGATGFLGIFLLAELLQQEVAIVCCLVRADGEADGRQRIEQNAAQYGLELPMDRCIIAVGSLAEANLGLPPALYQHLAQSVDAIWHCGAHNDHVMSYNRLRASNVQGTVEVLRLAAQVRLKPVHFISTYATGYGVAGTFREVSPLPVLPRCWSQGSLLWGQQVAMC